MDLRLLRYLNFTLLLHRSDALNNFARDWTIGGVCGRVLVVLVVKSSLEGLAQWVHILPWHSFSTAPLLLLFHHSGRQNESLSLGFGSDPSPLFPFPKTGTRNESAWARNICVHTPRGNMYMYIRVDLARTKRWKVTPVYVHMYVHVYSSWIVRNIVILLLSLFSNI